MKKSYIFILLICIFIFSACTPEALKGPRISSKSTQPNENKTKLGSGKIQPTKKIEEQLEAQSKIKKFTSPEEIQEFLENKEQIGINYSRGFDNALGFEFADSLGMDTALESAPSMVKKDSSGIAANQISGRGGGSDDYSETNIQVEGVDEADIIKTDGEFIYAVVKNDLFIIRAYPADQAEVLTKINFKDRPSDIYINDKHLVVYGNDQQIWRAEEFSRWRRRGSYTFLKVFNVTNPAKPKQIRDLRFEGGVRETRMIGDYVYLLTNNHNYYYIEGEPILPRVIDDGEEYDFACSSAGANAKCIFPDVYYFDIPYNSYNFTSINSINIKKTDEKVQSETYIMSASQNIFVSLDNIYITYTKHISEYELEQEVMKEMLFARLSIRDQEKINNIEKVENYVLNQSEKRAKISAIIERFLSSLSDEEKERIQDQLEVAMKQKYDDISKELEKTVIHKVAINQGNLEYQASGEVVGHVLNQFSMDENDGYFRIATTRNRSWSRYIDDDEQNESYSNLYVLDKNLNLVGKVEKLAPGERIYSARFMQDRAYLVTFKQTDPLFVIDLSVPNKPKVLGELKIPGFSNYLHPFDDDYLIGFGKDTKETEWGGVRTRGLKLSLFDVRDVKNPQELDVYVMGDSGSDSIALHDHKAFLFSKEKELLVLPVSIREDLEDRGWGKLSFSGAAVFKISNQGFELRGKIDHSDGGKISDNDYWRGYQYYDNTVKRSLYIDSTLYTFSNNYLMMNDMGDLSEKDKLRLKKNKTSNEDDFEIIN